MKIAHLSDLHLGRKSLHDRMGSDRLNALRGAVDLLCRQAPDAIVISGDVFDSPLVDPAIVQLAARTLDGLRLGGGGRVPVVLIPGNHDPSDSGALWDAFADALDAASAVCLARTPRLVSLCDGRLLVEAYPCATRYSVEPPWVSRLPLPPAAGALRVVVAHGTLQGGPVPEGETDAYPFTAAEVEALAANYVALGHFHGVYPAWDGSAVVERRACYAGTHEPDQFGSDSGWAILATLTEGKAARLERIAVGASRWVCVEVNGPADIARVAEVQAEVERDRDPRRFNIRVKIGGKTRLAADEVEHLQRLESGMAALGARVERRGEPATLVNVESLDLASLPSGAAKEALVSLQDDYARANPQEQEVLAAALQLGWGLFQNAR